MSLFGRTPAEKATRASRVAANLRYLATHEALWRNSAAEESAGIDYETETYLTLNGAAYDAARAVPWWRQIILRERLARKLDRED